MDYFVILIIRSAEEVKYRFIKGGSMKKIIQFIRKWILIFFIMSLFAFGLGRVMPVSPVQILLASQQLPETTENIQALEREWGLDKPIYEQYIKWISHLLKGDLGKSLISKQDIKQDMARKIPYSIAIGLGGVLIGAVLSFFLGYLSALEENGFWDIFTRGISLVNQTIPTFILAVILIYFIGVKYKLVRIFTGGNTVSVLLAIFFVAFSNIGSLSRTVRSHFKKVMEETYIKFTISRGFEPGRVLLTEGYRPVLIGLISAIISKFSWVIGGTAVVEFIFTIPGMSYFLVESMGKRDYNVIQSYIMFIVLWMFFVHLFFGIVLRFLDRRYI